MRVDQRMRGGLLGHSGSARAVTSGPIWLVAVLLAFAALMSTSADAALAQSAAPGAVQGAVARANADSDIEALRRAGDAVVMLRVTATDDATSAASLGQRRIGSGVVIDPDGLILTIGYLLLEAETIEIVTQDDRTLPARQVAYDLATGFGLVRPLVPLRGVESVPLAAASSVKEGEPLLVANGSSSGTEVGFTRLVSKRPFSGYWEYHIESALFTSPPVANHSGAPLFNGHGELIGIGSLFTLESAGGGRALPGNMFVPVDLLRPVLAEMETTGKTRASVRPWLGVTSSEQGGHVRIVKVDQKGPSLAAGLQPGDVVLEIDGVQVKTLEAFYKQLWKRAQPDGDVELTVMQGDAVRKVKVHTIDRMQTLRKPSGV